MRLASPRSPIISLCGQIAVPAIAWAHPVGVPLSRAEAQHTWSFEPVVLLCLAVTALLFCRGAIRQSRRPGFSWWNVLAFTTGWITLFVALVTPVHTLGSMLFWVHMTQHELLMIVAAPLLVLSRPLIYFLWALPVRARESLGAFFKRDVVAATWSALTGASFVWILHAVTIWAWHIPALYQASVADEWVHGIQHTMFLGTALLFWWTLLHGRYGRMGYGVAVIYVFTTAVHTSILGALMTFAQNVWYPIYDGRTAAWHLTALQDQQIGGLVMWVPAGIVFILLGLALLAAWIGESDRRVAYTRAEDLRRSTRMPANAVAEPTAFAGRTRGNDAA